MSSENYCTVEIKNPRNNKISQLMAVKLEDTAHTNVEYKEIIIIKIRNNNFGRVVKYNMIFYAKIEDRGGTVVKVLCYKSEGRWFDCRWCQWNFSLT
jgi:hypothetical protein